MKTSSVILLLFIQICYSFCQEPNWKPVAQLLGGAVRCLALMNDGKIIVATDSSLLSYNKKESWKNFKQKNLPFPIKKLCASKNNTLYAAKDSGYLYILIEGASSWKKTSLFLENPTTIISSNQNVVYISDHNKIYYSKNNGSNWLSITKGLYNKDTNSEDSEGESKEFEILSMCIDSIGNVFAGSNGFGIYAFRKGDSIWTQTGNEMLTMSNDWEITSLCSTADNVLYAGTNSYGIFQSSDNGKIWEEIHATPPPDYTLINALEVDSKGIIYAGTNSGILLSNDSGKTWINGSNSLSLTSVTSISVDRHNNVFLGTEDSGVFESSFSTNGFKQIGIPIVSNLKILAIGVDSKGNIYFSSQDNGVYINSFGDFYWRKILYGKSGNNFPAIGNDSSGNILVGHFLGYIYRTTDGGHKWEDYANRVPIGSIHCFARNRNGSVFVGNASGIVTTDDNGKSWRRLNMTRGQIAYGESWRRPNVPHGQIAYGESLRRHNMRYGSIVSRIFFNSLGHMFITTMGDGPQMSTDNGLTWTHLRNRIENLRSYPNQFFEQLDIGCFAFDSNNVPMVGIYGGIYRSLDSGKNWTKFFSITKELVSDIIPLSKGVMMIATEKSGVFYSQDDGLIWKSVNSGLTSLEISRMMATNDGYVYLVTKNGIYRSNNAILNSSRQY